MVRLSPFFIPELGKSSPVYMTLVVLILLGIHPRGNRDVNNKLSLHPEFVVSEVIVF